MIPLVLEHTSTFYNRWRLLFINTMSKYALDCLVLCDDNFITNPHWHRIDCTVKSWLFGMVAPDLIEVVSTVSPMSRSIWLGLEEQFIGNKETRAIILDAKFQTLVQGDLSITDYCNKIKRMMDALGTLGEPVLDHTLILNVLRGLNERCSHMAAMIKHTLPFPSDSDVCADLIEEVTLASKPTTATAFVAASSSSRFSTPRPSGPGMRGQGSSSSPVVQGGGGLGGGGSNRQCRHWRTNSSSGGSGGQAGTRPPRSLGGAMELAHGYFCCLAWPAWRSPPSAARPATATSLGLHRWTTAAAALRGWTAAAVRRRPAPVRCRFVYSCIQLRLFDAPAPQPQSWT